MVSSLPTAAAQQVLKGHVPSITKRLTPIRRLDSGARLDLAIGLPLRNREELTNLLQELYQPANANFRHYLTPDQFASSFGPSREDYQKVIDFAKSHGLIVRRTHPNRTLLDVAGSVADIEKAFHIHMLVYQHPVDARTFFAPDVEPSMDLDTPVLAISGLDNYVRPRPPKHRLGPQVQPAIRPLGGGGGGGGGGGNNSGPFEGYDFRNAYAAGVSQDGAGQSVGLFELFGFSAQDIQDYEDEVGIYPYVPVQPVLIDGASGDDSNVDWIDYPGYLDYAFEVTGDIEMAISMAPGLNSVLVYEGPTPLDQPPLATNYVQDASTTAQINDVLNRMATDDLARQLSCSYGFDINLSTVQIFQQFAAQGQSFFLASGDGGAYSAAVDEPADDPYITVVGGTTLTTTSAGAWASETAWLTPATVDPLLGNTPEYATGGGVSLAYAIPPWQQGISMTANQGSTTMRNLPDVSLVANNINLVWGNDFIGASSDWTEGGTSLATPLWAGFMALVNQQAAANGQPLIGFVNPALYAIGKSTNYLSCFHDITTGVNTNSSSPTKYSATAGYDLCTGWGTMIGSNLMQALLAPPSETLVVTPPLGFTSFGLGGGPFTVASQTYTLKNIGSTPLNWSLVNTSSWLTVSTASGSLSSSASSTVTISLNSAATNFLIGNYSGNVSIANKTDGTVQNRQFNLYVGNAGFETGDFTDWTLVGSTDLDFALAADDVDVGGTAALPGEPDELFVHSGLYGAYLGQYPEDGSLSQTVATTASRQYLVSFWLTCVPYQGTTTPNDFTARWNGSTLYAQTNLGAFGWTNLQFVAPATTTSTTLEFEFNNVPGAFGLDDVTVEPVPAPVFQSVALTGGTINLTWSSISNVSYQVQSASSLSNPTWTDVVKVTAAGNLTSTLQPVGSAQQQFYRVILLPAP
jgi:subtilase family serine protease